MEASPRPRTGGGPQEAIGQIASGELDHATTRGSAGIVRVGIAASLFGLSTVFVRLAYEAGSNSAGVLAVRGLAVMPWVLVLVTASRRALAGQVWRALGVMGVLFAANAITLVFALERMSPALVALFVYAYPIGAIVGAHLLGWTPLNWLTGLAATSTVMGIALVIGFPASEVDPAGVLLALLNAAGYATYLLLGEFVLRRADALTSIGVIAAVAGAILFAYAVIAGIKLETTYRSVGSLALLFGLLLVAQFLILSGVGRLGGAWGSLVSCLEVVTAVLATAAILGFGVNPGMIAGAMLILLGSVAAPVLVSRRMTGVRNQALP